MPVVVFGHGVMTERRFVLAIGDALAAKGFAAIAIDLPYHGTRTQCIAGGPISVVDPRTGDLTSLPPCQAGTTCNDVGRCVDGSGAGNRLSMWPVLNYPVASGAAFLEIEHIANTKDHFDQSVIELSALIRALGEVRRQPLHRAEQAPHPLGGGRLQRAVGHRDVGRQRVEVVADRLGAEVLPRRVRHAAVLPPLRDVRALLRQGVGDLVQVVKAAEEGQVVAGVGVELPGQHAA